MNNPEPSSVWHQAHGVSLRIYQMSEAVPPDLQRFIRERTILIPPNISREGTFLAPAAHLHMLEEAFRQVHQLEYLLLLSKDLGYLAAEHQERSTLDLVALRKSIHEGIKLLTQKQE